MPASCWAATASDTVFLKGANLPAAQLGYVLVGADVEIGACTTVDRGTYGPTIIGDGTKIDNLVMIAHNCRIGKHNMICSQVGVAGSTITGDHVVMAGQVGVRDHVRIGDRAILGAKAGVSHDVPADAHVFGIPAIAERDQKIQFAAISKLPEMRRQLKALQQAVDELTRAQGRRGSSCRLRAGDCRFVWGKLRRCPPFVQLRMQLLRLPPRATRRGAWD